MPGKDRGRTALGGECLWRVEAAAERADDIGYAEAMGRRRVAQRQGGQLVNDVEPPAGAQRLADPPPCARGKDRVAGLQHRSYALKAPRQRKFRPVDDFNAWQLRGCRYSSRAALGKQGHLGDGRKMLYPAMRDEGFADIGAVAIGGNQEKPDRARAHDDTFGHAPRKPATTPRKWSARSIGRRSAMLRTAQ